MGTSCEKDMTSKEILRFLNDEQWSNAACCGYLILACENLRYSDKEIDSLLNSIQDIFNRETVNQAKQRCNNY